MLSAISLLTAIGFAAIYPLCFWISARDPLQNNFHRFHIGLPCFVAGVAAISLWTGHLSDSLKILAVGWTVIFLGVTAYLWKKERVGLILVTLLSMMGMAVFVMAQQELVVAHLVLRNMAVPAPVVLFSAGILGTAVLCSAVYAMNLGHWYLNVHGLPIKHLMQAVNVFWAFLILRLVWDIYLLLAGTIVVRGNAISIWSFMQHMDGFFLWIAIFFGTLMPAISLYFVRGTLLVKSTQSATGILYVIVSAVLIGDMTYKYYLLKYGVVL